MAAPRPAYDAVVREGVAVPLTAVGFEPTSTRGARTWVRRIDYAVVWSVDVQAARFPRPDATSFAVNWGVVLPEAAKLAGSKGTLVPLEGLLQGRLGVLTPPGTPHQDWWDVTAGDNSAVVPSVRSRVERDLLPFLDAFRSPAHVLDFAEQALLDAKLGLLHAGWPGTAPIAVAALVFSGESRRAKVLLSRLIGKGHIGHLDAARELLRR